MERRSIADWFFPSIADVLFMCILFSALYTGDRFLNDGDTGWHIVTGENIIKTIQVPFADPYSHTMPGTPWTAHEWLAEIVFAFFHNTMGMNGVVLFSALMVSLTFFFLYRFLLYRGVNLLMAAFMALTAAMASSLHWLARPHIFSLPLTLAFIVIIELYQREGKNRLMLLPVLMAFWVNLHAGFILGLILIFLYAGGNLLLSMANIERGVEHKKKFKALGLTGAAAVLATFINPHGPSILYFPFHLVGRKYIMDNVLEWLSPNFHNNWTFEFMLLLFVVIFVISRKKPDIFEGGAALLLTHMSLYSARYIPLMAVIITPMAAVRAGDIFGRLEGDTPGPNIFMRLLRRLKKISANITPLESRFNRHMWVYASIAGCLVVALNGGSLGGTHLMDFKHGKKTFPVDALEFALNNHIEGKMFNNDGWGGYIIYRSSPHYKVFFDGRSDMYGVPFMKEYVKVARAEPGYEDILDKYKVDWVIYNNGSAICQLLQAGGKWRLVYADETADILVRDVPSYRPLIDKYPNARILQKKEDD